MKHNNASLLLIAVASSSLFVQRANLCSILETSSGLCFSNAHGIWAAPPLWKGLIANLKDIIYLQNVWFAHLSNYLSALTITVCAFLQKRRWRQSARKLHFFEALLKYQAVFMYPFLQWVELLYYVVVCVAFVVSIQHNPESRNEIVKTLLKCTLCFSVLTHEKLFSLLVCVCMCARLCFRSRFADFQHNCQPSPLSASGCMRERRTMCLKAYAGLIGETEENKLKRWKRLKECIAQKKNPDRI